MLFAKLKDLKKRNQFNKKEKQNLIKKFVFINSLSKLKTKKEKSIFLFYYYNSLKCFSKTKIVKRCILTNRSRGISKKYNISRVALRELLQFGIIPGFKKSVW